MPIDIDSDSNTKRLKNKKRRFKRISFVEAIVESKGMDTEFCWAEYHYCREHDEREDRKEAMRHDEVMIKAETCRFQLQILLETVRQRSIWVDGAPDKLDTFEGNIIMYCRDLYPVYKLV